MKRCSRCKVEKPQEAYYRGAYTYPGAYCKACQAQYVKERNIKRRLTHTQMWVPHILVGVFTQFIKRPEMLNALWLGLQQKAEGLFQEPQVQSFPVPGSERGACSGANSAPKRSGVQDLPTPEAGAKRDSDTRV